MSADEAIGGLRPRLLAALDGLPMLPRAVYLLSTMDGLDYAQIAFRFGLDAAHVEAQLVTALVRIDQRLCDEDPAG